MKGGNTEVRSSNQVPFFGLPAEVFPNIEFQTGRCAVLRSALLPVFINPSPIMKKLSFFSAALLLAAVFSAGCSKDRKPSVKPTPDKDAPVEILLSGGVVPATSAAGAYRPKLPPLTRAVINAEHGALEVSFARLDQLDDGQYPAYSTLSAALPATLAAIRARYLPRPQFRSQPFNIT